MRRALLMVVCALICISLSGCATRYSRYQKDIFDVFDTHTMIVGYASSREEFDYMAAVIHDELVRLHRLFDIFNEYDDINNLATINNMAGISPVEVDKAIIYLLEFAISAYEESGGAVNVAMGNMLEIWRRYRQEAGTLFPSTQELNAAMTHSDISNIIIDRARSTVYLSEENMSLDVGALAKGFALQEAMGKAVEKGFFSGLISSGGDIIVIGAPMSRRRDYWSIGIRDPRNELGEVYDTLNLSGEMAVATSGDYYRYFMVDGIILSHIIDPQTMMPASRFASVTAIHQSAVMAEMLSTALFILPYEEGKDLLELHSGQAIWLLSDGSSIRSH